LFQAGGALAGSALVAHLFPGTAAAVLRDRVQKLKSSGRKVDEVVAAKPTADLDAVWGKGFMMPNDFVTIVYNTL
jgi:hypothetical protein